MINGFEISSLNFQELSELMQKIQNEQAERKKTIASNYGELFCKIVGEKTICLLPEVDAKSLGLDRICKYPSETVKPSMLGNISAVRGILCHNRPFIAIKIEAKDSETQKVIGVFVEVVFKRYSLDGDGKKGGLHEDNYVTAMRNITEDGEMKPSFLYRCHGLSEEQIQAVKDLLDGKEILDPVNSSYLLKKV